MSKHSQQLLVEHLQAMRALLVEHAASLHERGHSFYLGLCVANYKVKGFWFGQPDAAGDVQIETVKDMIAALPEFQAKGDRDYMFPTRQGIEGAEAGHERRLEILDGWIADAQRKLRAAVFRDAIDRANNAGRCFFMCRGVYDAVRVLTGYEDVKGEGDIYNQCMSTLRKYKPCNLDEDDAWFDLKDSDKRLRIAILSLCLTDVLRHGE